ncbi:Holliday junction branch migration protein RuvA [Rhizomicrobium electricum]|uniref:Holliday junction branch migration complex subunit RuvA n=1 Tax=Rhizomicrobium electricum TaxID=480070 RepID=A0ABP3PZU7_9PROT|nr:Holliday junction branch migration protein RuvA [Rhizomicrobium electricum]NIJ50024.1 Holliday junction DNA helicase RuvA [Rhizomicrobium electricum]
MIGKLTGIVDTVAEDHVILDVGGVGYLVQCPSSTLGKLTVGERASLLIEMRVSEDAIRLFGFVTGEEREWFRLLQSVQSVGAKVALNILSTLSPKAIGRAIALGDKAMIGQAQGVGPKLATRIVTELKDKAPNVILRQEPGETLAVPASHGPEADAVMALTKLGYSQSVAAEAVARAGQHLGEGAALDALIREALRAMGR